MLLQRRNVFRAGLRALRVSADVPRPRNCDGLDHRQNVDLTDYCGLTMVFLGGKRASTFAVIRYEF